MLNFKEVKAELNTPKKIVIIPHKTPDADALGSSLGLRGYLIKKGHHVQVISPTDYPKFLNWMEGNETVRIYNSDHNKECSRKIENADIVFCLDFNNLARIDELGLLVEKSAAKKFLIDHHLDPTCFADFSLISTDASATAELIYEFIGTSSVVVRLNDRANFKKFHDLGCLVVDPNTAMVSLLDNFVRSPVAASMLLGTEEGQATIDLEVRDRSLHGVALRNLRLPSDVIILSVKRKGHSIISHGYTRLRKKDIVTVVGSPDSLEKMQWMFSRDKEKQPEPQQV